MNLRNIISWFLRAGLAAVFLYAGILKAVHPGQLELDIKRYHLVSSALAWLAAAYLPYLEILIGLALLLWRRSPAPAWLAAVLLALFAAALASAWQRELNVECGCFGHAELNVPPPYVWWLMRDLTLLGAALALASSRPAGKKPASQRVNRSNRYDHFAQSTS